MTYRFFVVDDDKHYARLLSYRLEKDKAHEVRVLHTGEALLDELDNEVPDLVLLDIMMPGIGGMETLRRLRLLHPDLPVVMISAQGTVDVAVECMRGGADDYITKGQDDLIKLDAVVKRYRERIKLAREVEALRGEVAEKYGLEEIVGDSPAMEGVYRLIQKTLRGNLTVAIQGESGTGKELVARAIHFNTRRKGGADEGPGPFVVVNCAAIPKELMESEFFGHEKGSFTGAHSRHIGKFEQADGGTLFLDEVGELDLGLQAKLLRALQNREITRVGGSETIRFQCRVISATNKDIVQMVADGTFREDLYYRLFQFPVELPPLRARGQDVLLLAHEFLKRYGQEHPEFKNKRFSAEATRAILGHAWPGNVRELKNAVERAVLISDGEAIAVADLLLDGLNAVAPWTERTRKASAPRPSGDGQAAAAGEPEPELVVAETAAEGASREPVAEPASSLFPDDEIVPLEDLKRRAVEQAYRLCEGNVDRAAVELGIGRATMYRLLKKYEISGE